MRSSEPPRRWDGSRGLGRDHCSQRNGLDLPHGGACPKGRCAEDGTMPFSDDSETSSQESYGGQINQTRKKSFDAPLLHHINPLDAGAGVEQLPPHDRGMLTEHGREGWDLKGVIYEGSLHAHFIFGREAA